MTSSTLSRPALYAPIFTRKIERHQRAYDRAIERAAPTEAALDRMSHVFAANPAPETENAVRELTSDAARFDKQRERSSAAIGLYSREIERTGEIEANVAYVERVRVLTERRRHGQMNGREFNVAMRALRIEFGSK